MDLQAVVFKEIVLFLAKTFLLSIIKKFVIVQKVISCKGCRDQCWNFWTIYGGQERYGTTTLFLLGSKASIDCSRIPPQESSEELF